MLISHYFIYLVFNLIEEARFILSRNERFTMRFLLVLASVLVISYILLMGIPATPGEIQVMPYFNAMKTEIGDLIDHFSLMTNPWVKVTLIAGAALIFVGFVRQFVR